MKENLKIFIAEDEDTLAEIYSERFKRAGFEVNRFRNGLDMLQQLSTETPDVILLDIMMPEIDGFEVLHSIEQNFQDNNKKSIPIVVWSNQGSEAVEQKAIEMGAKLFLKKIDYTGDDLVEKVKSILR